MMMEELIEPAAEMAAQLDETTRARLATSRPNISKKTGSAHCVRSEIRRP